MASPDPATRRLYDHRTHTPGAHGDRGRGGRRAAAGGRVRHLRHHRRPRQGDDLPVAVPARAPRPAGLPDRRRRRRRLDRRRPARARAHARSRPAARRSTSEVFERFAARLLLRGRRLRRPRDVRARRARRIRQARAPGLLPRDPAVPVRDGRQGPRRRRADRERARRRREAVRPRPRVGAGAATTRSTSTSTSPSCTGSTTSSGRWASPRSSTCASRTRCFEPIWNRNYVVVRADHDGRGASASRTAATSTTRSARCATSSSTT